MTEVTDTRKRSARQRRLDGFCEIDPFLATETRPVPGSTDHTSTSPGSSPIKVATATGTVVRTESDLSSTLNTLDSITLATGHRDHQRIPAKRNVGQYVGRHVGTNLKYSRVVGQHVGQHLPENEPASSTRETRALKMLAAGIRVSETDTPGVYLVPSETGSGFYTVRIPLEGSRPAECSCPDFGKRAPSPCKHIALVRHWIDVHHPPVSQRVKRRSRPNALAFSKAQMEEGNLFPVLLQDLCAGIPEPERDPHRAGRPPIPRRDLYFCAIQQVYHRLSGKLSNGIRREAEEHKFIRRAPYSDVTSKALLKDDATSILMDLLARSIEPFKAIETKCAIDSTGFRTTRFHYYRNEKYTPTRTNEWLKVHALVGLRTHAVLAVEVTSGNVGDSPQFKPLLERAAKAGFEFKEVLADKAYNSRANFEIANKLGVRAYIPFKANQSGQSRGSLAYHQAFLLFAYHRSKFDEHYRHRGQVEVSFGAIKQVIGETVTSRNFTSQVNEILCKLIAYNITRVIHTLFSLGILQEPIRSKSPSSPLDVHVEGSDRDSAPQPLSPIPVPIPIAEPLPPNWTPVVFFDWNVCARSAWTVSR